MPLGERGSQCHEHSALRSGSSSRSRRKESNVRKWGGSGEHLLLGTLRRSRPSVNPGAFCPKREGEGGAKGKTTLPSTPGSL